LEQVQQNLRSQADALPPGVSPAEPVPAEYDLKCEFCGYSLIGLTHTDICPECGKRFDPIDTPLARVPWLYRRKLGRLRAYLATARLILADPNGFASELSRPVRISMSDAWAFRKTTLGIVTCSNLLLALWMEKLIYNKTSSLTLWTRDPAMVVVASLPLTIHILLLLVTNLPTFIWRGLQQDPRKLSPLHHYACTPLILFPLVLLGAAVVEGICFPLVNTSFPAATFLAAGSALIIPMMWRLPVCFMESTMPGQPDEAFTLKLYLPLHWLVMFILVALVYLVAGELAWGLVSNVLARRFIL
jgi:hypothetical protein